MQARRVWHGAHRGGPETVGGPERERNWQAGSGRRSALHVHGADAQRCDCANAGAIEKWRHPAELALFINISYRERTRLAAGLVVAAAAEVGARASAVTNCGSMSVGISSRRASARFIFGRITPNSVSIFFAPA